MMICGIKERVLPVCIPENENSKNKTVYNSYFSMNLKVSSDPTHNQEKDILLSNLHELRKQIKSYYWPSKHKFNQKQI